MSVCLSRILFVSVVFVAIFALPGLSSIRLNELEADNICGGGCHGKCVRFGECKWPGTVTCTTECQGSACVACGHSFMGYFFKYYLHACVSDDSSRICTDTKTSCGDSHVNGICQIVSTGAICDIRRGIMEEGDCGLGSDCQAK